MATTWTDEQLQVIETRHKNLLVSAAAGSGKTAVLVERIIRMITDPDQPVDIDRLLVMTFTNAAAAEMRERVETALGSLLDEDPGNKNLERQSTLIHHAKITTIDRLLPESTEGTLPRAGSGSGIPGGGRRRTSALKSRCDERAPGGILRERR